MAGQDPPALWMVASGRPLCLNVTKECLDGTHDLLAGGSHGVIVPADNLAEPFGARGRLEITLTVSQRDPDATHSRLQGVGRSSGFHFGKLPVQGGEADAQERGGFFLVVPGEREGAVKVGDLLFTEKVL